MNSCVVQLLLPLADNAGVAFPDSVFEDVKGTLVKRFGGVTAYTRSPAQGVWSSGAAGNQHDDIVIVEVMAPDVDSKWWGDFRAHLETLLRQDEIVVRAFPVQVLDRR